MWGPVSATTVYLYIMNKGTCTLKAATFNFQNLSVFLGTFSKSRDLAAAAAPHFEGLQGLRACTQWICSMGQVIEMAGSSQTA